MTCWNFLQIRCARRRSELESSRIITSTILVIAIARRGTKGLSTLVAVCGCVVSSLDANIVVSDVDEDAVSSAVFGFMAACLRVVGTDAWIMTLAR